MKLDEQTTEKQPKLNSLSIEAVKNGFILYENEFHRRYECSPNISDRMVFNTKEQLNEYINKNF